MELLTRKWTKKNVTAENKSRISLRLYVKCFCIKFLYSNTKNADSTFSAFCFCSSFFKHSASAETKRPQFCVGLNVFNLLFA